jgi:hypothetical protein
MSEVTTAVNFSTLPLLGATLEGGIFAGLTTRKDGIHCAVILLPENGEKLTWRKAIAWAAKQGGELPSRPVAALLFANLKAQLQPRWHWTCEEDDASYAWVCSFYGSQNDILKSNEGSAVAVRLIPLTD